MPEEDYEPTEKWNMAEAFLRRVDAILWECKVNRGQGSFDEWYRSLDNLYVETSSKLKEKASKEIDTKLKDTAALAAKFQTSGGNLLNADAGKLAFNLREIDILLHKALDEKGLLTPKAPDARTAIVQ